MQILGARGCWPPLSLAARARPPGVQTALLAASRIPTDSARRRWYSAPEVLYGSRCYDGGVDWWASALVLAEMLRGGVPLLAGQTDVQQLSLVRPPSTHEQIACV